MTTWIETLAGWPLLDAALKITAVAGLWWLLVMVVRRVVAPRLSSWSARTHTGFDDALAHAMGKLRLAWGLPLALWAGLPADLVGEDVVRVLRSAAWIGIAIQAGLFANALLDYWIRHARDQQTQRGEGDASATLTLISIMARVVVWALLVLMLLDNLGFNVTTLVAGLGVGGIAIGLAVQKVLGDLFAYFAILFDKPFEVGHFLALDDFTGTVEHIGIKTTRLRSLGGELLVFSNADLTQSRLRNYQWMRERRIVFAFGLEYATPADVLERVPKMVCEAIEATENARFDRAHFHRFGESSLDFEVVYWMTTPTYLAFMDAQQSIHLALLRRFEAEGIGIAFPSRTLYVHQK